MIGFNIVSPNTSRSEAAELVARYLSARNSLKLSERPLKRAFWDAAVRKAAADLQNAGIDVFEEEQPELPFGDAA